MGLFPAGSLDRSTRPLQCLIFDVEFPERVRLAATEDRCELCSRYNDFSSPLASNRCSPSLETMVHRLCSTRASPLRPSNSSIRAWLLLLRLDQAVTAPPSCSQFKLWSTPVTLVVGIKALQSQVKARCSTVSHSRDIKSLRQCSQLLAAAIWVELMLLRRAQPWVLHLHREIKARIHSSSSNHRASVEPQILHCRAPSSPWLSLPSWWLPEPSESSLAVGIQIRRRELVSFDGGFFNIANPVPDLLNTFYSDPDFGKCRNVPLIQPQTFWTCTNPVSIPKLQPWSLNFE